MKKIKNFLYLISTLIMACLIISIGYRSLNIAGNYFIVSENDITTLSTGNDNSYAFYSQADSDITLFPWNYYEESRPLSDVYLNADVYDESDSDVYDILDSIIEKDYLYENIRYYFYKTISSQSKEYINSIGSSLSELIKFDYIADYITVMSTSMNDYFFYKNNVTVDYITYELSFSFDLSGNFLSFQCRQIEPSLLSDSPEMMEYGTKYLSNFITQNEQSDLGTLLTDIEYHANILENYTLHLSGDNYIYLEEKNDKTSTQSIYIESDMLRENEYYDKIYSYDYSYFDFSQFVNNSSYQIVETNNELLLILIDNNIVLHFEPSTRRFNGFNKID